MRSASLPLRTLRCMGWFLGALMPACDGETVPEQDTRTANEATSSLREAPRGEPGHRETSGVEPRGTPPVDGGVDGTRRSRKGTEHQSKSECPPTMRSVPGGPFWVGTEREVYDREENPRFQTRVATFCADVHEVSTAEYEQCVIQGHCAPLTRQNQTCNTVEKGRGEHPINCIDFKQASQVCSARGARLPTEVEWEYMARGGGEMREYPWGTAHPDGNTCWKHAGTCARGSYPSGAFGLHDVVGNVWEWTSSYWGRYPWPVSEGDLRVYRGGSWSRRFEKWLRPTLRNRLKESGSGSHLGVRCVKTPVSVVCPYGTTEEGRCRYGIDAVNCLDGDSWNGIRCVAPGDTQRCGPGTREVEGHGCVRERVRGPVDQSLNTEGVSRGRSPEFDQDCRANYPGRPQAYRFTGGGHLARNVVGSSFGCKNRDVGVGFNSACCPKNRSK